MTEDQAWKCAAAFFQNGEITNIQSSEVVPYGQSIWQDKEGNQEMIWSFRVNRLVSGINHGGIIFIDAYDCHVVEFSGFQ